MSDAERWRRLEELCHAALEHPVEERAAFLADACGPDEDLRREAASLLDRDSRAQGSLATPMDESAAHVMAYSPGSGPQQGESRNLIGRRIGTYEIRARIGAGGMGEVYRARDTRLARDVALKILPQAFTTHPERRRWFEREARVLAALNHPNIGAIYGIEEDAASTSPGECVQALVLELVEGPTLADRLASGPISVAEALTIGRQLADALDAAHAKGIVHRDLKPTNIKITHDGIAKVLDFGLAKAIATGGSAAGLALASTITQGETGEGVLLGTAAYMSPEQARGQPVDKRTDIWAFGCVLFEMLTGHAAFARATVSDTIVSVLTGEPNWSMLPPATPPRIRDLLERCLDKDPKQRLRDIGDARLDVTNTDSPLRSEVPASIPMARRHWAWAGLLAVLLVAGFFASRVWRAPESLSEPEPVHRQLTFLGTVSEAALSPDGRTLAYTTADRLLIQDVAGGPSVEIARGKISAPRWSPLGDQVAFVAADEGIPWITLVSRLGGPSRRITRAVYAAWSPDGSRLAVADQNGASGLGIIDMRHGSVLHRVVLSGFQFMHDIDWHPGLDRLALLERNVGGWTIWITAPNGSETRQVYTDAQRISSICWSPIENIIYFVRSQNEAVELLALDVGGNSPPPPPRVLMSGLPTIGHLTISADGRSLVQVRSTRSANLARLDLTSRNNSLEFITHGTNRFDTPRVSPDGKWVAARVGVPPHTRIVKMAVGGGEVFPLTSGDDFDGSPAWSPDGTRMAFASTRAGTSAVWLIGPDGTQRERINNSSPSVNLRTSWTRDGKVMWQEVTSKNQMNYRIRDLSGGDDSMLLPGETYGWVFWPEFSPRGTEMAIWWNRLGGPRGLYVLSWPSRLPRLLREGNFSPVGWSADGRSIIATGENGVWSISLTNGELTDLARVSVLEGGDVTPDGKYLIASVANVTADAWLIENLDTREAYRKRELAK